MDNDVGQEILMELRKQTTMHRRTNTVAVAVVAVFLFVFVPFADKIVGLIIPEPHRLESWQEAKRLNDVGEVEKARAMLQRLIQKHPRSYYGYVLMGSLNLQAGLIEEAEKNYAQAYALFPAEELEKTLASIRKGRENQSAGHDKVQVSHP